MECPICYDDMQHKSKFTGTCFHQWCMECHRRKIKYDKLCPLCRCSHANLMEPNLTCPTSSIFWNLTATVSCSTLDLGESSADFVVACALCEV